MNENGLPVTTDPAAPVRTSVMYNCNGVLEAVRTNVKLAPPLARVRVGVPVAPVVEYVGVVKSLRNAIAPPNASIAVTVHEMTSPVRAAVVKPVVWPTHARVEAAVADDTLNEKGLPVTTESVVASFSVM